MSVQRRWPRAALKDAVWRGGKAYGVGWGGGGGASGGALEGGAGGAREGYVVSGCRV